MLTDVNLLYANSVQYNGESHAITATALKIVKACEEQFEEHAEQFDALERNLDQPTFARPALAESQSNEDNWQQMLSTDLITGFQFNPTEQGKLLAEWRNQHTRFYVETEDNAEPNSPAMPGMSLETFITCDLTVMEHHLENMESEPNLENPDDPQPSTERITTEDILGRVRWWFREVTANTLCFFIS